MKLSSPPICESKSSPVSGTTPGCFVGAVPRSTALPPADTAEGAGQGADDRAQATMSSTHWPLVSPTAWGPEGHGEFLFSELC